MLFWITPCASAEMRPACGRRQRARRIHAGRAQEAVGVVEQVEHRRDDERARDDADHERPLLPRRRRVDELAGLEVLQVVVGDGRHGEHHRGQEERERHQRLPRRSSGMSVFTPSTRSSAATTTTRMPMPDSGLLEEPMSPAM